MFSALLSKLRLKNNPQANEYKVPSFYTLLEKSGCGRGGELGPNKILKPMRIR